MSSQLLEYMSDDITLMEHQAVAVKRMAKMTSGLEADEMGLGKTVIALAVASVGFSLNEMSRVVVVCPASLKGNWANEIADKTKFTWQVLEGTTKQRDKQLDEYAINNIDVLIVNYEQVIPHIDQLNALGFGMAIYDEAHYLKNRKSKRTKASFRLVAGRHWLLTGSPLLNQVDDLWALMHRIAPSEWGSYWSFVSRYAVFGGYMDKQIVGVKNEAELREKLGRFMIRRTKDDELNLPPKMPAVEQLDLHPVQLKLYKQARDELLIENVNGDDPFEIENALVKLLKLKQICGTTATIEGYEDHSSKLDRAQEKAVELHANGEAVVVFTQFRKVQECFVARLESEGVEVYQLHGDVKPADRQGIVSSWSDRAKTGHAPAIVCMVQVAGVGLTMTEASHLIRLDKLFVPKLNDQAVDRLHRIGQTKPVTIHDFNMKNTIEARIDKIIKQKEGIFGQVVDTNNSSWKKMLLETLKDDDGTG